MSNTIDFEQRLAADRGTLVASMGAYVGAHQLNHGRQTQHGPVAEEAMALRRLAKAANKLASELAASLTTNA